MLDWIRIHGERSRLRVPQQCLPREYTVHQQQLQPLERGGEGPAVGDRVGMGWGGGAGAEGNGWKPWMVRPACFFIVLHSAGYCPA